MLFAYRPGGGSFFFDGFSKYPWATLLAIAIVLAIAIYGTKMNTKRRSRRDDSN